jgi:hypothetical protein
MRELFAVLPGVPGDLLAWSLALAFAAVFLAVFGVSMSWRPAAVFHRLDRAKNPSGAETGAGLRSAPSSGSAAKAMPFAGWRIPLAALISLPLFLGAAWLVHTGMLSWVQGVYAAGVSAVLAWTIPGRVRAWRASRWREA